ncbi:hypothetical protein RDABS01_014905 [Bienertia sinuspersici]
MADLSEIPRGIGRKIALEHLETLEDVESFKEVCSLWRSETSDINHTNFFPSSNIQLPWLMLADSPTSSYRRFYSLRKGMYRKIDLPHFVGADDYRKYFSSKGWLIAVSRRKGLITFYDPFSATGTVINPPTMPFDYFYDGLVTGAPIMYYIVPLGLESASSLLVVSRYFDYDDGELYWTEGFELFEVNVDKGTATQVHDIGNWALFIGHNSTLIVEASPSHKYSCRSNCIYFTDDNTESYDPNNSSSGGGADMGIYNLEFNQVVDRLYQGPSQFSYQTPPLWMELPHY